MKILNLDITSKCNLSCEFCYQDKKGELSMEQIIQKVDEFNPKTVCIGGGEPIFHLGFYNVLKELSKKERKIIISTNGVIFYDKLLNSNKKISLQISLPTTNSKLYEEITGCQEGHGEDYFGCIISNVKEYSKLFPIIINTPVYQKNFSTIEDLIFLARKELQIPIRFNLVVPLGRAKNVPLLNTEQLSKFKRKILEQRISDKEIHFSILPKCNCTIMEKIYGIEKQDFCPIDLGDKLYISPDGSEKRCEFE